jgi:deazaflavin-dependent oxidoreductase (nitroreductase family)
LPVLGDRFYSKASQAMGATGLRWTGKLNVPLYRMSGGRLFGKVNRAPVLLLTTTGRKSGLPRTTPVVYLADGKNFVVIGSNAGHNRTPAWSLNLKARPQAEIEIGHRHRTVRARVAVGEERSDLWRRHNEQYSGFDEYEARTGRDIAVFVLEPSRD